MPYEPDLRSTGVCSCGRLYTTYGHGDRAHCGCGRVNGDGWNCEYDPGPDYSPGDEPQHWEPPKHLTDEEPPF